MRKLTFAVLTMHVVELRVERSAFAEILAKLREWIDRNGADPVKFESATGPSSHILVKLEFSSSGSAAAFRREWADITVDEGAEAA